MKIFKIGQKAKKTKLQKLAEKCKQVYYMRAANKILAGGK